MLLNLGLLIMVLLIDMFQNKKGNIDIQSEDCSINFP